MQTPIARQKILAIKTFIIDISFIAKNIIELINPMQQSNSIIEIRYPKLSSAAIQKPQSNAELG